ncbi:hypothetical protein LY90DRAFT_509930 [Neocallimastix californiae]|uniref:Uncharacterized protein n=1 Tax=Neocallimastix californiae TaxID=1754190 RepID=A0A1Y2C6J4_9FUNG|nr:hypothetical protein LY90DRAFT_509930 [Neocallimastix californiae]|eukprot:ORY42662.1 hypothetical protein LY90DRAFT_509930 [Neocallimastix californiae]
MTEIETNNLKDINGPVPNFNSKKCLFIGTNVCIKSDEKPSCVSSLNVCSASEQSKKNNDKNYNLVLIISVIGLILAILFFLKMIKKNKNKSEYNDENDSQTTSVESNISDDNHNRSSSNENGNMNMNTYNENDQMINANQYSNQSLNQVYNENSQMNAYQYNNQSLNQVYMNNYQYDNRSNVVNNSGNYNTSGMTSPIQTNLNTLNSTSNNGYSQALSNNGVTNFRSPILGMNNMVSSTNAIPQVNLYSNTPSIQSNNGNENNINQLHGKFSGIQNVQNNVYNNKVTNEEPPPYIESEEKQKAPLFEKSKKLSSK